MLVGAIPGSKFVEAPFVPSARSHMELDARTATGGTTLSGDVCIVGAGPVGLALADALAVHGLDVVLVERGSHRPRTALDRGQSTSVGSEVPDEADVVGQYGSLHGTRAASVGGTATIWNTMLRGVPTAKYVPLEAHDFQKRSWIPHSGWPIPIVEVDRYYPKAHEVCGLEPFRRGERRDGRGYPLLDFSNSGLSTGVYHYGAASRFTRDLPERISRAAGTMLLHGAAVSSLVRSHDGTRVEAVSWTTTTGVTGSARAAVFVLAAGAIENARLLLLSDAERRRPPCSPWLGRGFMEHPVDSTLELTTSAEALLPPGGFYSAATVSRDDKITGRIALTPELLASEAVPSASVRLVLPVGPWAPAARVVAALAQRTVPFPLRERFGRLHHHRQRSSFRASGARYRLWVDLEQVPSRENRVTLSDRCDSLGRPRALLHWRWSESDESRRARVLKVIVGELESARVGRVRAVAKSGIDPRAHHHLGTTRMGSEPSEGVVDTNLRVYGLENLHVVGSSVFPTGGFANPTLTALALTLRLADHLAPDE